MRNKKREKISRELEIEKQKLKKASVIDEITINMPKDAVMEDKQEKRRKKKEKKNKEKRTEVEEIIENKEDIEKADNTEIFIEDEFPNVNHKKHHKKKKHTALKVILLIVLAVFIVFAGIFIKRMNQNGWTLGGFVATMLGHDSSTLANLSRVNVLLIGQSQNLTDTLLVCSYDPKTQDAAILSVPRDTFIGKSKNYASAYDKINSVFQRDPEELRRKVCEITGLDIPYYIKVDTHGLRELVDSVGGIYFNVPIDMNYDDPSQDLYIHVKKGYQLLDGSKAEQVVRFRHNNDGSTYPADYGEQDLGRMRTQREFLTEVFKQMVKPKNITAVDDYINIAKNNVDTNFNIWKLKDYAPYLLDYKIENLKTGALPGAPEKINNLWFYSHNKKETQKLVSELFKTELTEEQEENTKIKVKVLNGTSDEDNLINVQNLLKENGYTVEDGGSTSLTKTTSIINRTNQNKEVAEKLKETIGVGEVLTSSNSESDVDFTIIIGDDYQ